MDTIRAQLASFKRSAPEVKGHPIFGMIPATRRNRLKTILDIADQGEVVRFRLGPFRLHLLSGPRSTHHALVDNHKNYDKQWMGYRKLAKVLGNGLITSDGDFWLRQRRIAQPSFHRDHIAGFADVMTREIEHLAGRWDTSIQRGNNILDIYPDLTRLTLDVIGQTMLSYDVNQETDRIGPALSWLLGNATDRISGFVDIPLFVPTPTNLRFRRDMQAVDSVIYTIIAERRLTGEVKRDLLSMFMSVRDEETGEGMNDLQLHDEIMTMFMAGFETTLNTLSWTFWLLALHPEVGRKLYAELERELGGRTPTLADLPRLRYTKMVLDESLRLYPPVWLFARNVKHDDEINGFHIAAGTGVFITPYMVHRDSSVWDNPEGFDPERFAPERVEKIPKGAYIPFGAGPRACIGRGFALLEAQLTIATLWQRFRLDLVPTRPVEMHVSLTLRPRSGVHMKLHRR